VVPNTNEFPFMLLGTSDQEAGTRLESVDEIRAALQSRRKPTEKEAAMVADTADFRPVRRLSMAMICLLDDGKGEGEWIRLRRDVTIIGRSEGEIVVPHESEMSGRHLAIARVKANDRFRWFLTDLESSNGSFARISKSIIRHGQEMLIGGKRYRFEAGAAATAVATTSADPQQATRGWQSVKATDLIPSLVELTREGEPQRFFLKQEENWIGRDSSLCTVVLADDILVSPRHARLARDNKGIWVLENAGSRNGTWLRFKKLAVDTFAQFQVGEQRCLFKVLT
jgi:pSer/pThr/pTyr-binding forkhead associated (FHA) protein